MCGICKGSEDRRKEIDSLLEDRLSQSEIAIQVFGSNSSANKARIQRYAEHRATEIASPSATQSQHGALYTMLEKLLKSAIRKGLTKRAVELTGQIADLKKLEERQAAREAEAQPATKGFKSLTPEQAVYQSFRNALGGEPRGKIVELENVNGELAKIANRLERELCEAGRQVAERELKENAEPRIALLLCIGAIDSILQGRDLEPKTAAALNRFVEELNRLEETDESHEADKDGPAVGQGGSESGNES